MMGVTVGSDGIPFSLGISADFASDRDHILMVKRGTKGIARLWHSLFIAICRHERLCGDGYQGYSFASQTIGELSAIGAPTRQLWVPLGIVYTLLVAAFGFAGGRRILPATERGLGAERFSQLLISDDL